MNDNDTSPFHAGERDIQSRLGVRERMERLARRAISDHLPEQHRTFYRQLPFVVAGHADTDGRVWASWLADTPGFITSPDPGTLHLATLPMAADPLSGHLTPGTRLGVLGIEFHSRRRNRLAAHVTHVSDSGITLAVDRAFGNCPKYIQARTLYSATDGTDDPQHCESLQALDASARTLIAGADTFFVASGYRDDSGTSAEGFDASHRGGRPGFVRIDDAHTLTIPDYAGNLHFNTLGNFLMNPAAGLLFVDFSRGDILMLSGRAEILWDDPDTQWFAGAQRLWRFTLNGGRYIRRAMHLRGSPGTRSREHERTGTWQEALAQRDA